MVDQVKDSSNRTMYDLSALNSSARTEVLKTMSLAGDEKMMVNCSDTPGGCTMCETSCSFEAGSVVSIEGTVRLPHGASSSAMRIEMKPGAKLMIEGGERALEGQMNGTLEIDNGTVFFSDFESNGLLNVSNAMIIFDVSATADSGRRRQLGDGDGSATKIRGAGIRLEASGKAEFAGGTVEFKSPLVSNGFVNITAGKIKFDEGSATSSSKIKGQGMEIGSAGQMDFVSGDVKFQAPLDSKGLLNISSTGTVKFDQGSQTGASLKSFGGQGVRIATGGKAEFSYGHVKFVSALDSDGLVNITAGAVVEFGAASSTDGRRRLTVSTAHSVRGPGMKSAVGSEVRVIDGGALNVGNFDSEGFVNVSAQSQLNIGGVATFKGLGLKSNGAVKLSGSAGGNRRRLQSSISGSVTVSGSANFESEGSLEIPAGSSLTLNTAGTATIGGSGVQNAGSWIIQSGSVNITSGAPPIAWLSQCNGLIDLKGGAA